MLFGQAALAINPTPCRGARPVYTTSSLGDFSPSLPSLFPHLKIRVANGDGLTRLTDKSGQQLPEPGDKIRDEEAEVVPPVVLRTLVGNFGLSGCSNIGSGLWEPQPTHISPHTFRL